MDWTGVYCGPPPSPDKLLQSWNFDPFTLALIGAVALWAGRNRSGYLGTCVLVLIFLSPLCALSSALFSARVVHHVLLVAVAAPLIAISRTRRWPVSVGLTFLVATATLWLWHLPAAYDGALNHKGLYWVMQASLFGTAVAFWRAAFALPEGIGAGWVFLAYLAMGLLGAILTLAPNALYSTHAMGPLLWGFEPLADQQLGGLIMWMPAGLIFAAWGGMLGRRAWRAAEGAR